MEGLGVETTLASNRAHLPYAYPEPLEVVIGRKHDGQRSRGNMMEITKLVVIGVGGVGFVVKVGKGVSKVGNGYMIDLKPVLKLLRSTYSRAPKSIAEMSEVDISVFGLVVRICFLVPICVGNLINWAWRWRVVIVRM